MSPESASSISGRSREGRRQLVVLSTCETGIGEVRVGEGAETQVISLWKVADDATRDLMTDFYRRLLRGAGRSEALRQAQLKMLHAKATVHPFFWAAFIPSGLWMELDDAGKAALRADEFQPPGNP